MPELMQLGPDDNDIDPYLTPCPADYPPCPLCGKHPDMLESGHIICCNILVDNPDAWFLLPRAQLTALIAWQFQAAGAALALQRLMDAAQAMREAQAAYEQYGSNEDSVTEAEEVFVGLLADMRHALEARHG